MALSVKVGRLQIPTSAGTQAITGLGFKPKAIIFLTLFLTEAQVTGETLVGASRSTIGLVADNSGTLQQVAYGFGSANGVATASAARRRSTSKCCLEVNTSGTASAVGALQSMDADGFTLNWTVAAPTANRDVLYLALGGTDLTNAAVLELSTPTTTGNVALTGAGFSPSAAILATCFSTTLDAADATGGELMLGAIDNGLRAWVAYSKSTNGVNPSDTVRHCTATSCIRRTGTDLTALINATPVSLDADGLTLNFATAFATSYPVGVLLLKGPRIKVGPLQTKVTTAAPVTQQITDGDFTPKAALFGSVSRGATSAAGSARLAVSMSDGTTSTGWVESDLDNVSATNAEETGHVRAIALANLQDSVPQSKGDLQSWNSDGYTLNWVTNDSGALFWGHVLFGDDRQPVGAASQLAWNDRAVVVKASQFVWNDRLAVGAPSQLAWADRAAVGAPSSLRWNARAAVAAASQLMWNDRVAVANSAQLAWADRVAVGVADAFQWSVRAAIGAPAGLLWAVRSRIDADAVLRWADRVAIGAASDLRWADRIVVGAASILAWRARSLVDADALLRWNTRGRATADAVLRWADRIVVGDDLELAWRIRRVAGVDAVLLWSVEEAFRLAACLHAAAETPTVAITAANPAVAVRARTPEVTIAAVEC